MAATIGAVEYGVLGAGPGGKWVYAEITMDSAYASAGETVNARDFGLQFFKAIFTAFSEDGYITSVVLSSDKTSALIKVWVTINTTTSQASPTDASVRDLSNMVIPVLVRGI